ILSRPPTHNMPVTTLIMHQRYVSLFLVLIPTQPTSTLFPYTTLFRSLLTLASRIDAVAARVQTAITMRTVTQSMAQTVRGMDVRSEEHTSELQSRRDLVCRLLLEKKNAALSKEWCESTRYVFSLVPAL